MTNLATIEIYSADCMSVQDLDLLFPLFLTSSTSVQTLFVGCCRKQQEGEMMLGTLVPLPNIFQFNHHYQLVRDGFVESSLRTLFVVCNVVGEANLETAVESLEHR
jgi:hypothetical protein